VGGTVNTQLRRLVGSSISSFTVFLFIQFYSSIITIIHIINDYVYCILYTVYFCSTNLSTIGEELLAIAKIRGDLAAEISEETMPPFTHVLLIDSCEFAHLSWFTGGIRSHHIPSCSFPPWYQQQK
jgi:hypothetical protein